MTDVDFIFYVILVLGCGAALGLALTVALGQL